MNPHLVALECHRGHRFPPEPMLAECPTCSGDAPSGLYCVYDLDAIGGSWSTALTNDRPPTMWRYRELLPVAAEHVVTLGEGATPLVPLERLGRRLGMSRLHLKDEAQNPTWSFKDRLASVGASKAVELGRTVMTAASSGNAGASVSAYAARAGLKAVILTSRSAPAPMRALMDGYGALTLAPDDSADRGRLVRLGVERYGWFAVQNYFSPPVGANPFALEGCKPLAYEICEQLGWRAPDAVVFPITNGDTLVGAWRGFLDLVELGVIDAVPRLYGAEVYGPLARTLAEGSDVPLAIESASPSIAISAAARATALQVLRAVRETGGWSLAIEGDAELLAARAALGREEGIFAEASAALPLAVLDRLRDGGHVSGDDLVVVVSTSGGLKDFDVTGVEPRDVPRVEPTEAGLVDALERHYDYKPTARTEAVAT